MNSGHKHVNKPKKYNDEYDLINGWGDGQEDTDKARSNKHYSIYIRMDSGSDIKDIRIF